jgi:hypothetical protein
MEPGGSEGYRSGKAGSRAGLEEGEIALHSFEGDNSREVGADLSQKASSTANIHARSLGKRTSWLHCSLGREGGGRGASMTKWGL